MTRRELEAENRALRAQLDGADRSMARMEAFADRSADLLEHLLRAFSDLPEVQARVSAEVMSAADAWRALANEFAKACKATQH